MLAKGVMHGTTNKGVGNGYGKVFSYRREATLKTPQTGPFTTAGLIVFWAKRDDRKDASGKPGPTRCRQGEGEKPTRAASLGGRGSCEVKGVVRRTAGPDCLDEK